MARKLQLADHWPEQTESVVPGSRCTKVTRETYFPPVGIHRDAIWPQVTVLMVDAGEVHAMSITDHLPGLGIDLGATLAGLGVHNFPHGSNLNLLACLMVCTW